ncbi:MAG: hypothetical protein Kow0077_01440 [Anaerolineae bacterium]
MGVAVIRRMATLARIGRWVVLAGVAVVIAVALIGLAMAVALHVYGRGDRVAPADVIIVLGAGIEPDGSPSPATRRRALHAAALYRQGVAPHVICAGGYAGLSQSTEAAACAQVLLAGGVPQDAIRLEAQSRSTEENAIHSAAIMREAEWRSALVVSDSYHLLRAAVVFPRQGVPVAGYSPAQVTTGPIPALEYLWWGLRREVMGLYWQAFKTLLRLPYTHVPFL